MSHQEKRKIWLIDQITKGEFFRQKLHESGFLETAYAIESIKAENLPWDHQTLGISEAAWNKIIHRGIKPVTVFAHPAILTTIKHSASYYQYLAIFSMQFTEDSLVQVECLEGEEEPALLTNEKALGTTQYLNQLTSQLIEEEQISLRMLDLWRGMIAGAEAQSLWQDEKENPQTILI